MALYKNRMWFGTRDYMQWILAPQINYDSSKRGYAANGTFLNGGAFVKRSSTAAKGYNFTWSVKARDEIRAINDYADGIFGDGPIYFLDPFAMDKNLLPQFWASPMLAAGDAPLLVGLWDEDRPSVLPTTPNGNAYPVKTATYSLTGADELSEVWIPCPPGYTLWVGAHGTATGSASVQVVPTLGATGTDTPRTVPLLSVNDATRVNTAVDGNVYNGAILRFGGKGTLNITGLMAQVFPSGVVPPTGEFISGQGHSGCSFTSEPQLTNYSVGIDKAGVVVDLIETEGWK